MNLQNFRLLAILCFLSSTASAVESIRLTDVVKSNGTGTIDILKDVTASELEQLRVDNNGTIVFGVDVNESASGTEKSSTQAVTLGAFSMTVVYNDSTQRVYDLENNCCTTETQTLVAEYPDTQRLPHYTLLGESGSSRITSNNSIQGAFDSTLKVVIDDSFFDPASGLEAVSVIANIAWLDTNTDLGDPETFYDYTNGFEDLALLNETDTIYIDEYAAGRDEALAVVLTYPETEVDLLAVETWNYFPSASSYYLVAYEDLYPKKGDYDFNDLTVAYQVRFGLNNENEVVSIRGTAYLITRGAAFNHDWHLRIPLPLGTSGTLSCTTFLDPNDDYNLQDCAPGTDGLFSDEADLQIFSSTRAIFFDPSAGIFANTLEHQRIIKGPKSTFRVDLDVPVPANAIAAAPFDPYLFVQNTNEKIQLFEVNPDYKDENGYPFGMLMPVDWLPPYEYSSMSAAYPLFDNFVASEGIENVDWYKNALPESVIALPPVNNWAW